MNFLKILCMNDFQKYRTKINLPFNYIFHILFEVLSHSYELCYQDSGDFQNKLNNKKL